MWSTYTLMEDNIKMYLKGIKWEIMKWITLDQDGDQSRVLVYTAMKLWIL
jgi:hypothetical protein